MHLPQTSVRSVDLMTREEQDNGRNTPPAVRTRSPGHGRSPGLAYCTTDFPYFITVIFFVSTNVPAVRR